MPKPIREVEAGTVEYRVEQFCRSHIGTAYSWSEICAELGFDEDVSRGSGRGPVVHSRSRLLYGELTDVSTETVQGTRYYYATWDREALLLIGLTVCALIFMVGAVSLGVTNPV